jgi:KaiC/GvpD/RAD55 family RecA-like ATPase
MSTFDVEFEHDILANCLREDAFLKRAARIADAHHFSNKEAGWFWKVISETWTNFGERATPRIVLARAEDEFKEPEKRKPYIALALKLFKHKSAAPKAALDELSKFVRQVNIQISLEQSAKHLEKGELELAESVMYKGARATGGERKYTHINWWDDFETRQAARKHEKEHPEEFTIIPTGMPQLDKALSGGARKGEVCLIMGTTGRGKSVLLNNVGHAGVKHGFCAVYFALEMPARQVATRQDALWSGMRYDQFKGFDFKPSELRDLSDRRRRGMKRYKDKYHIISMPVKSADIRTLKGALDDLRDEYGFVPSLVLVDSGDHMRSVDRTLDQYRLQQAEVYWSLKQLAEEDGYVLWSTVHAGREWAHQIATAEATSESYDKARIADLIVTLNDPNSRPGRRKKSIIVEDDDDEDEPEEVKTKDATESATRRMELYLAKYRDGVSKLKIELDADFSRMLLKEVDAKDEREEE